MAKKTIQVKAKDKGVVKPSKPPKPPYCQNSSKLHHPRPKEVHLKDDLRTVEEATIAIFELHTNNVVRLLKLLLLGSDAVDKAHRQQGADPDTFDEVISLIEAANKKLEAGRDKMLEELWDSFTENWSGSKYEQSKHNTVQLDMPGLGKKNIQFNSPFNDKELTLRDLLAGTYFKRPTSEKLTVSGNEGTQDGEGAGDGVKQHAESVAAATGRKQKRRKPAPTEETSLRGGILNNPSGQADFEPDQNKNEAMTAMEPNAHINEHIPKPSPSPPPAPPSSPEPQQPAAATDPQKSAEPPSSSETQAPRPKPYIIERRPNLNGYYSPQYDVFIQEFPAISHPSCCFGPVTVAPAAAATAAAAAAAASEGDKHVCFAVGQVVEWKPSKDFYFSEHYNAFIEVRRPIGVVAVVVGE